MGQGVIHPSSWQQPPQIPSLNMAHHQTPNLSLSQLSLMYPEVQRLHTDLTEEKERMKQVLSTQAALVDTQAELVKENMRLSTELREASATQRFDS